MNKASALVFADRLDDIARGLGCVVDRVSRGDLRALAADIREAAVEPSEEMRSEVIALRETVEELVNDRNERTLELVEAEVDLDGIRDDVRAADREIERLRARCEFLDEHHSAMLRIVEEKKARIAGVLADNRALNGRVELLSSALAQQSDKMQRLLAAAKNAAEQLLAFTTTRRVHVLDCDVRATLLEEGWTIRCESHGWERLRSLYPGQDIAAHACGQVRRTETGPDEHRLRAYLAGLFCQRVEDARPEGVQ